MNYQGFYPNYMQNYQTPQTVQQSQSQVQQSAFISVKNIDEAYNWPVGPGNSLTFKDENAPYIDATATPAPSINVQNANLVINRIA